MTEVQSPKQGKGSYVLLGAILALAALAAIAYFVPFLDCPSCEPGAVPEAGEITEALKVPTCRACAGSGTMTVVQYVMHDPPEVKLPIDMKK